MIGAAAVKQYAAGRNHEMSLQALQARFPYRELFRLPAMPVVLTEA